MASQIQLGACSIQFGWHRTLGSCVCGCLCALTAWLSRGCRDSVARQAEKTLIHHLALDGGKPADPGS